MGADYMQRWLLYINWWGNGMLAAYDRHPSQGLSLAAALGCEIGSLWSPANLGTLARAEGGGPPISESQSSKSRPPFVAGGRGMRVESAGASVL